MEYRGLGKLSMNRKRARGFNLIELMVVVAAIGVLAALAYPSYQNYIRETRRAQAQAALTDAAAQQEQFFLNFKAYAGTMAAMNMPTTTTGGFYNLSVVAPTGPCPLATCFVLQAAPTGGQAVDTCGTMTLSNGGAKTPAANCW